MAASIFAGSLKRTMRGDHRQSPHSAGYPSALAGCGISACGKVASRTPCAHQKLHSAPNSWKLRLSPGTPPMRICIFGAGAVGSHFAVRLALAGHEVSCVMRGPHLAAVKANGLTLRVGRRRIHRAGESLRRSGRAGPAGSRHQHAEGDRPRQPRRRPAAAAARRHRRHVCPERHSLVVRHRPASRSSAAAGSRLSRSRRRVARGGRRSSASSAA